MITKIIIDSVQSPVFGGVSFGDAGRYEKLVGRAFGELDPALNGVITDIGLALEEIMVDNPQTDDKVSSFSLTYPAATLDQSEATLTVRKYRGDQPAVIPTTDWKYLNPSTIGLLPAGEKAFERGLIYQFLYPAA